MHFTLLKKIYIIWGIYVIKHLVWDIEKWFVLLNRFVWTVHLNAFVFMKIWQNIFCVSIDLEVVVDSCCQVLRPITSTNGVPSKYSDIYDISKILCTCHFKRDLLIWGMSYVDAGQWFIAVCLWELLLEQWSSLQHLKSIEERSVSPRSPANALQLAPLLPDPLAGLPEFPSLALRISHPT